MSSHQEKVHGKKLAKLHKKNRYQDESAHPELSVNELGT